MEVDRKKVYIPAVIHSPECWETAEPDELNELEFFDNMFYPLRIQEHEDIVNSFSRGESNKLELNTNLILSTCSVEQCVEAESEQETSLEYTLPNDRYVDKVQEDSEL